MTPPVPSPDLLRAAPSLSAPPGADAARMRQAAQDFEAAFIAQMLRPMFEGLRADGAFGGGHAEDTWRSFLVDEMAKTAARAGGIGLADQVMAEMIRTQAGDAADGAP